MKKLKLLSLVIPFLGFCSCKKDKNNDEANDQSNLRVRRYTYDFDGRTNYQNFSYNADKKLDSIIYYFSNGNTARTGYAYTNDGFNRENIKYLTDNDGRITLQSIPTNSEQYKAYYDTKGRLDYIIRVYNNTGLEEGRYKYVWDDNNNLLQYSLTYVTFSAGQRLVKDSFVYVYSGYKEENKNTAAPANFGFDHMGTAPVNAFFACPDGIHSSRLLPAAMNSTHYIFSTPRINYAAYTSLEDYPTENYTYTRDSKGRVATISHLYDAKTVLESYEYME